MDTTRVFNSECTEYVASSETMSTIFQRIFITMKFFVIAGLCLFWSLLKFLCYGMFRCRSKKDISGQVALVTGAGNGLGRAIALRLAKEKCNVAIVDIDIVSAEKTVQEVLSLGVKAKAYKMDVSDYEQMLILKGEISRDLGCVTILVNNAGLLALVEALDTSKDRIQKSIDVNICSQIWTTKIFIDDMVKQGRGHIVAICSLYGLISGKSTMYSVTKNALHAFMGCLREEIYVKKWQDKIKTTCVYPFFIATRKEITDVMDGSDMIINSPSYAASVIVKAMKAEEEILTIPKGYFTIFRIFSLFPPEAIRNSYKLFFGKDNPVF
ncbi:estradiol 17-beta-dehydrogenase 11 [Sergentomyia squamirostris]